MSFKVIVAHPGRQHSYRLASALKKNGMLAYYCTTIYDKTSSKLMQLVKKFLSSDNLKRANGRRNSDLADSDVVQYCELGGMIEAFLARVDKTHKFYMAVQQFNADRFGKKVAKLAIKNNVDAVICYDTNALTCFKYLKKKAPNILRIQDVSHSARPFEKEIFEKEIRQSGNRDFYNEDCMLWNKWYLKRTQEELNVTQFFIVPSKFVKNGLTHCGIAPEKIYISPYGANVMSNIKKSVKDVDEPLHLLFVGLVNYRKGVIYMLDAISRFPSSALDLTLVGDYNPNDWFIQKYKHLPNVTYTGRVPFDTVKEIYEKSDVFIIDSFAEGMAQVGIEAMACGLPIICSTNSGVNDLVTDGENGFVIPCGDADVLTDKIKWFLDNKHRIIDMGEKSSDVAKNYTWDNYEIRITDVLKSIIEKNAN